MRRRRVSEGMLANTADTGTLEYNTVDGTLWFVHALGRHVAVTGDDDLGSRAGAGARTDRRSTTSPAPASASASTRPTGCCAQGADGWALTWMDARIDGVPVTPRRGKPVEVERAVDRGPRASPPALRRAGADRWPPLARARRARRSSSRFVRPDGRACSTWSTARAATTMRSVRPNQLLAVSLPDGPLAGAADGRGRAVVDACRYRS